MADVGWVRLSTRLFENRKIKYLLSQPKGSELALLWVRLLCLAGTINDNGKLYVSKNIPYTPELLASDTSTSLAVVKRAQKMFCDLEMIYIDEQGYIEILGWEKHQNVTGLNKIKEQAKERARRFREKHKDVTSNDERNVTSNDERNVTSNDERNVTVTLRNATEKRREEKNRKEDDYHHLHNDDDDKKSHVEIFLLWEKNIMPLTPLVGEKLKTLIDEVGEAAVEYAISAAVEHGARNFSYVQTVARNYASGNNTKKSEPGTSGADLINALYGAGNGEGEADG